MEKFNKCENEIRDLGSWLSDLEQQLANIGNVKEHPEELRKQISQVEVC